MIAIGYHVNHANEANKPNPVNETGFKKLF